MTVVSNVYKIGDLARMLNITPRTIRYYDQLGLLPNAKRTDGNTRVFDEFDIQAIKNIRKLQKAKSTSLQDIKKQLFPSSIKKKDWTILTDSDSNESLCLSERVTCVVLTSTNNNERLNEYLNQLKKLDAANLIFFFHKRHLDFYEQLKKKVTGKTCFLFPLNPCGLTFYAVTDYVLSKPSQFNNLTVLLNKIEQMLALSFEIRMLEPLSECLSHKEDDVFYNKNLIAPFFPVVFSSQTEETLLGFKTDSQEGITRIVEWFNHYFVLQKRYFEKISVFYTKNEQVAKAVKKEMGRHNPNLLVNIQHIKNDRFKKRDGILITII